MTTARRPSTPARSQIIAHRGASHDAPENTLAAIQLAWQQKADAVEVDVQLSKDGQLVVIHDANTRRTCGVNAKVGKLTLAELKTLDAGKWKGLQWVGEKIPTLDEALAAVPKGKSLVIEIKCGPESLPELKRSLQQAGLGTEQIILVGFSLATMELAKHEFPKCQLCWIVAAQRDEKGRHSWPSTTSQLMQKTQTAGLDGIDLDTRGPITSGFVRQLHAANLKLFVWTVDSLSLAKKLIAAGVDGLTTNRPGWLREKLAAN